MSKASKSSPDTTLHIYTRVSTALQRDEGTSLQTQLELGVERAKQLGFTHQHWDEGGKSSHHEDIAARPKLAGLYQAIKDGQVKHLFIYDQSRLSRNDQVASIFRYECDKQGVTLYTKDGRFDLSNPQDKLLKQILDGLSEFDNAMRAERTRLGKLNRVRVGGWHGGPPPYGYSISNKKLVVNAVEAAFVRKIYNEALGGASPKDIRARLEAEGAIPRRGGTWTLGSIAAILKNSHYTGSYQFTDSKSEEQLKITCPAIVDPDTWQAVQLKRTRAFSRVLQQNATRRWFYLLRDLMYCGHCGRPISGRQRPSKREKVYYCANKEREWAKHGGSKTPWKRGTGCGMSRSLNIIDTDALVFDAVQQAHRSSRVLREEVKQRVLAANAGGTVTQAVDEKALQAKLKRLLKEIAQTEDLIGTMQARQALGEIPKRVHQARARVFQDKLDALTEEVANTRLALKGGDNQRKWVDWYKAYGEGVDATSQLSEDGKKGYIAGLVERIDVRYDVAKDEHELLLRFHLPIVGDSLKWREAGRRGGGYELLTGKKELPVRMPAKTSKSGGKPPAP